MDAPFGGSAGLLQRLRPTRIGVADLHEVAGALLPGLATPDLRLDLVQRSGSGSVVVLEEGEHRVRVQLDELADDMTRAGVPPTPAGISAALSSWVAHRPVTDAAAAAAGIAVLDWRDHAQTAVGWRVVLRRGDLALPWVPSSSVEGPVALWSHAAVPVLATAALVAPERMIDRIADAGLGMTDMHVVVTPCRPVACAGEGVAARLAGETTEASVTLPWGRVADLPWI
jgi:hypothetical protein